MKTNLKNFPRRFSMPFLPLDDDEKQEWARYWKETEDWYKGFEKELREIYVHQKVIYKVPTVSIKEVLGE